MHEKLLLKLKSRDKNRLMTHFDRFFEIRRFCVCHLKSSIPVSILVVNRLILCSTVSHAFCLFNFNVNNTQIFVFFSSFVSFVSVSSFYFAFIFRFWFWLCYHIHTEGYCFFCMLAPLSQSDRINVQCFVVIFIMIKKKIEEPKNRIILTL